MKEHQDDVLLSVKESPPTVDSAKADENVTKKGKIEGVLSEKEEGEDTMVDVVGADVVVDHHGGTKVDLDDKVAFNGSLEEGSKRETETRHQVMEDVGVVEEVCDVSVESKELTLEKVGVVVSEEGVKTSVEVSKELIRENVAANVASGSDCGGQKSVEPVSEGNESGSTKEIVEQSIETVQEVVDKDEVMDEKDGKEAEVLNSSKNAESLPTTTDLNIGSQEGHMEAEEGKDNSEDDVKNETLSTEVVNAGTGEDNVNLSTKKLDQEAGVDQTSAESLHPITEVTPNDGEEPENGTKVEDSKTVVESLNEEPQLVGEEIAIKEEELKRDITVEDPAQSVQEAADVDHVMNEKSGKDEVLDSEKIPETVIKVDEVVVQEDLSGKDEAKDGVSDVISSDTKTGKCVVDENAENLDQKAEINRMSKEDSSHPTIEVKIDNAEKSEKETEVEDSKMDDESANKDPQSIKEEIAVIDKEKEPESGSIVEPPVDCVQEVAIEDGVKIEKTAKEVEILDSGIDSSTKIPESSTIEEVDVEGLEEIDKAEDGVSVDVSEVKESTIPAADDKSKTDVDTTKVTPTIGDASNIQEDQGLKDEIPGIEPLCGEHGVLPTASVFSYEEAHMERGEDAGMDIDEVLGWKDEMEQHDQKVEDFCRNQETETLHHSTTFTDEVNETETETSVSLHQSCYFHPPENEGEFLVSDLVWGKVRSHPWWPGQIFDPSDASEKAMKYHKKDCFLVAYFGDRTFAWNDSSVLKPFRAKFSQIEKHSSSEAFNNAVHCALEEVSRRVELGLSCSCVSNEVYEKIKCQIVENAGIRLESSRRHGVDRSASVSSFEPDKLVDYVKLLAKSPYGEGDKLEITMAKAQLSCYGRFKGYRQLAEFQFCGDLLEDSSVINEKEKEKILPSELTVDATANSGDVAPEGNVVSSPGSKKRKAVLDSVFDNSEKRQSLNTETTTLTSKPSFKVGECIQRVASQLTGSVDPVDQPIESPGKLSNQAYLPEMLSQLHLAAQDPMKGYTFLNTVIPFFNTHRSAVLSKLKRESIDGRKRKPSNENDPEEFEFDDVNDSYWTDRIIQNYPEEQLLQENQNGGGEQHQIVAYEQQQHNNNNDNNNNNKPVKATRRSNKKRFFSSNHEIEAKEQSELIERRRQNLATEVLMKFPEGIYFPSEIQLNKMFKRFGPLMESETEVDRQSCRARVVFKKCSDAEVAHSSAGKFNIFGSISVNYELNYTPLISYKPLPLALPQDPANAC